MKPAPPVTITVIAVIYPHMFITFEGLDGSGKTTQALLLGAHLQAAGIEVVQTREPGGTPLGEEIRTLVLHGGDVAPWAEAALYAAARAQHVEQLIRPALDRGATVLCDRYVDSSVAYQGVGRGLGLERVLELNLAAVGGLMPDCTILLEVGLGEAASRMEGALDRIEREGEEFRARVAAGFRELAARFPERYVTVDGAADPEVVAEEIRGALRSRS
jgi:dTMP kinase